MEMAIQETMRLNLLQAVHQLDVGGFAGRLPTEEQLVLSKCFQISTIHRSIL